MTRFWNILNKFNGEIKIMQISDTLREKEIVELQKKFYKYFETGYVFENFLKEYLLKIGLDEVEITQRSRDGGIDLKAIRKGIGDFSDIDVERYYIQAKRYKPKNKISVKSVRELKGTIPFGYKGILITTSEFTKEAKEVAKDDISKLVILIDGKSLITSCIDNEIGFVFKPVFSSEQMDIFFKNRNKTQEFIEKKEIKLKEENYIEKMITSNDIRARIVSVPSSIMSNLKENEVKVLVNNEKEYRFSINKRRNYFAKVTGFLKEYELLTSDGVKNPKKLEWIFDKEKQIVKIYIENQI